MLFNSLHFIIFFPLITTVYFVLPFKFRWILLLIANYYFYMCWKPEYVILIILSTLVDYYASLQIAKTGIKSRQKKFLYLSLFANFGMLFLFKYFNFFAETSNIILQQLHLNYDIPALEVLLPIGISFYTFQTVSYTIDVYHHKRPAEKHLGFLAVYVSFFPQLVAGPIERVGNLLPQFSIHHRFKYERVKAGLQLMLWGFFKKLVIADRLGIFVEQIYNNPANYHGFPIIIATVFFAFQIYCDFSGYSDIAIGAAKIMGYRLMKNFRTPYLSKSIGEFWKRWHISLSTWFRDYVYIPLGGNRVVKWRWYYNLLLTFLISGLWHGANWTFIIWGALHGVYMIFSGMTGHIRKRLIKSCNLQGTGFIYRLSQILITFTLTCFSWIFFRANTLSDSFLLLKNLCTINVRGSISAIVLGNYRQFWESLIIDGGLSEFDMKLSLFLICSLVSLEILNNRIRLWSLINRSPIYLRWSFYLLGIFTILFFSASEENRQFIYFQF